LEKWVAQERTKSGGSTDLSVSLQVLTLTGVASVRVDVPDPVCLIPSAALQVAMEQKINRIIKGLDAEDFNEREDALRDLKTLGMFAVKRALEIVDDPPSVEIGVRLRTFLSDYKGVSFSTSFLDKPLAEAFKVLKKIQGEGPDGWEETLSAIKKNPDAFPLAVYQAIQPYFKILD
jgi:hypothetical protein